jgi:Tfp pilus assembly protein FimT
MMVVVAIACIIAGLAATNLSTIGNTGLYNNERLKVEDSLIRARNMARMRGECVRAAFSAGSVLITSYVADAAKLCTTPFGTLHQSITVAIDPSITVGVSNVDFNTTGGTVTTTPTIFTIVGALPSQTTRLMIYPAIGQVREASSP